MDVYKMKIVDCWNEFSTRHALKHDFQDIFIFLASLLGFHCESTSQCLVKVENSECVDNICKCEPTHVPYRRHSCLLRKSLYTCK